MKTSEKFVIVDKSSNSGKIYINQMDENVESIEDAFIYDNKEMAEKQAKIYGEWATVVSYSLNTK